MKTTVFVHERYAPCWKAQPQWWKDIQAKKQREWRAAHPDRLKAQRLTQRATERGYFSRKVALLKQNRIPRGIKVTVTSVYLLQLYHEQKGLCALSGIKLVLTRYKAGPNALSVDRIRHDEGYTPGNVRLVTWQANAARGNGTDAELRAFCRRVLKLHSPE